MHQSDSGLSPMNESESVWLTSFTNVEKCKPTTEPLNPQQINCKMLLVITQDWFVHHANDHSKERHLWPWMQHSFCRWAAQDTGLSRNCGVSRSKFLPSFHSYYSSLEKTKFLDSSCPCMRSRNSRSRSWSSCMLQWSQHYYTMQPRLISLLRGATKLVS